MNKVAFAIIASIGGLFLMKHFTPRGIRNNNPGNIRKNDNFTWQGETGMDNQGFVIFDTPENGLRALARTLRTYLHNHGLDTIEGILTRYAPKEDGNDTRAYINAVAQSLNTAPGEPLTPSDYPALIAAIVHHENGQQPYTMEQIETGFSRGFA